MKKYVAVFLLPLAACGNNAADEALVQEEDYEVSLIKDERTFTAYLTYTGEENTEITYGSDLFLFHLTSDANDIDEGTMIDTLSQSASLAPGESITEEVYVYEITEEEELPEGSYKIEAEARFTDEDGENREMTVDKTFDVEER